MAFASGAVTFRRYRISGCKHQAVDDALLEALSANAFGRYGCAAEDDVEVGWITPQHLFDVDFAASRIAVGRFAHLCMRMDRNSAPAAILRSYVEIEQAVAREASGREYLTKKDKHQAKEIAAVRAEKEAKSGAFRRITTCPVLFDLERQALYVGSTAGKANEKLQRLFADTFDAVLEPVTAHKLALRIGGANGQRRSLEDARPAHLVAPPEEIDGDVYSLDPEDRGFLGREFLSWLWHRVDSAEGMIELLGKTDVAACVTKVICLRCDFNLNGSAVIRADAPASLPESRAALASGKQPTKMGLLLGARTGEWSFVLDAVPMDVSALTLPPPKESDAAARMEERFESIAELAEVLDALFAVFLRSRLSSAWPKTLKAMTKWAAVTRQQVQPAPPRLVSA